MKKSKLKVSQLMLDEMSTSTPPPDYELTTIGKDLLWTPPNFIKKIKVKVKVKQDLIESIL